MPCIRKQEELLESHGEIDVSEDQLKTGDGATRKVKGAGGKEHEGGKPGV